MPKVSIIVPVYNTEKYLKKCLDSLINQTLQDIEILIINDGSTDNSEKVINEYKQKYFPKVRTFKKENKGLSDTRNFAIPECLGEYIGFVDSDDYIDNEMYENMYNKAIEEDLDLVECNFVWEYPNRINEDKGSKYTTIEDAFLNGRVMVCNKIIKTSIIKENNISFPVGLRYEDIEFFYKLMPFIKKSDIVEKPYYHYMQRANSIINTNNYKTQDIFIILNNIKEFYLSQKIYEKYNSELEYLYIRFLLGSSFLRIVKINDKTIRKQLLNKTIDELYNKYPNWKKNKILKIKTKKNIYYKSINKTTFKIYSFICRIFKGA